MIFVGARRRPRLQQDDLSSPRELVRRVAILRQGLSKLAQASRLERKKKFRFACARLACRLAQGIPLGFKCQMRSTSSAAYRSQFFSVIRGSPASIPPSPTATSATQPTSQPAQTSSPATPSPASCCAPSHEGGAVELDEIGQRSGAASSSSITAILRSASLLGNACHRRYCPASWLPER